MSIDILFIHPGNQKQTYQKLADEFTAIAPPVWTSLLAGHLRKKGFDVAIYDANLQGWSDEQLILLLKKHEPKLVVLMVYGHNPSASTQTMPAARLITQSLKRYNKDVLIALGGIHPSALPLLTMQQEAIDFVIQGEGVRTLEQLINYLKGKVLLKKVEGLWYREADEVLHNEPAPIIQDLDEDLGDYSWDLLPSLKNYRAHTMHCFDGFKNSRDSTFSDVRAPYAAIYTSLGCPFNCRYCCINSLFSKPGIRYWSVDKVTSWIDDLYLNHGVRTIRFDDELFILSAKRVQQLCDALIERKYDLNIWAYGRVDTIQSALLAKLKKAGFQWICLGIESANESVRAQVNKNLHGNIFNMVKNIQSHGIAVLGNFMFGLPTDTRETMQETLDCAMVLNSEFVNFYSVMGYPGSELFRDLSNVHHRTIQSWEEFSQHSYYCNPMPTLFCSAEEVLTFRDMAFARYYSSESYQQSIEKKYGSKVVEHIRKMISIPLQRKLILTQY